MRGLLIKAGLSCGNAENRKTSNVAYAIAFPLASIPEDLYSFTCCPDSSVVERHLGKMEVPGSIPGRGSHDDNLRNPVNRRSPP